MSGLRHGAIAGAILWGAFVLGLYSISTAAVPLLACWWIGQTIELGLAGAVLGAVANGASLKRTWAVVVLAFIGFIAGTFVLQNLGLAPAMKVTQGRQDVRAPATTRAGLRARSAACV